MAKKNNDETLGIEAESPATKQALTVELEGAQEATSLRLALLQRMTDLEKEARRLTDLGRAREANALMEEAGQIELHLLPQVSHQRDLPFRESDVRNAVLRLVGKMVEAEVLRRVKATTSRRAGESEQDRTDRAKERVSEVVEVLGAPLADITADLVLPLLTNAIRRGNTFGIQGLEITEPAREVGVLADILYQLEQETCIPTSTAR